MNKKDSKNDKHVAQTTTVIDETALFERVAAIIENRKYRAAVHANQETTLMFWEIGKYINQAVLGNERAAYGKKILSTLSTKLMERYGESFAERNLYRMSQFATQFSDVEILSELSTKLSWSHFVELLSLKKEEARMYYASDAATLNYGIKELRRRISRKAFERQEIANAELAENSTVPFNVFKDPYLLDTLGLKDSYLEADLENAILDDIKAFFLEFGHGFAFIDRQKRMNVNGDDIVLDLLFYHREIKRLVAVELKLGKFKAAYVGQMLLYLKWLDKYERKDGEETPIGLILCASANRETVELLDMDKAGIAVAEYWTHLPAKAEFEAKIKDIMVEAKERLARRKLLSPGTDKKQIEYFYDPIGDGEDDDD